VLVITKTINILTWITRYIALTTMVFMMLFIAFAVFSRLLFTPTVGDVELVQLGMVVLIMCGLAYTQHVEGHITIDLVVKKLPEKVQRILDVFACLMILIVTIIIAYIYIDVANKHMTEMKLSTNLLGIPFYPFDYIIVLGFVMWGLEAFLKLINSFIKLFKPTG
jgi:TRAP-type C4-dicarboxylate transport system permease small subunit